MQPLPIDSLIPQLLSSLQTTPNLILQAAPGAGKTTRVPPALLAPDISKGEEIWVLEPRRIAARMSAHRVAQERGEPLGATIGYQIRFEEISSSRTRLRFITEGVFTRKLLRNPTLKGVAAVVLDEFHERHLQSDLALALLRQLQLTLRPDLKVIVMSATLDAAPLAVFLGDCPILNSEGRTYEISVTHQSVPDSRPVVEQVTSALKQVLAERIEGDILVFLPGAAEIRRAMEASASLVSKANLLLLPLHGELSTTEQDRAVKPSSQRKVIFSTNVAETSITIEGVAVVIDSGLARIASHSPWSGLPQLNIQRISKASATQRAGRAGRTQAGKCLRLYSVMDFAARPEFELPELLRLDLAATALELHALGVRNLSSFPWFESPTAQALESAETLLQKLGAVKADHELTALGEKMLRLPLHPRQSRIFWEAESRGFPHRGALIAALLGEHDLWMTSIAAPSAGKLDKRHNSDLFLSEALYAQAESLGFDARQLHEQGINSASAQAIRRTKEQILRPCGQHESDNDSMNSASDEQIKLAVLTGYPDRVGKRQESDNGESIKEQAILNLSQGGTARLSPDCAVEMAEYQVALDVEEKNLNRGTTSLVRRAIAIQPDWLLDLFPSAIHETINVQWDDLRERVVLKTQLCYEKLVLDENLIPAHRADGESRLLIEQRLYAAVLKKGWQEFLTSQKVLEAQARIMFIRNTFPEQKWPDIGEEEIQQYLAAQCGGKSSFTELRKTASLELLLQRVLTSEQVSFLNRLAPERLHLVGRKNIRINYEEGKTPWIALRIQEVFGMTSSPTIAQGKVPLVLHLLAPNQRPIQITNDLAGFWTRTYPGVRRELSRRYPKHAWPENPLQFSRAKI